MVQVINITSTANDTNAEDDSNIVITFSEDINQSTVEDNIKVRGSQTGIIAGSFNTSGSEVTFNPTSDFKVGEQITVEVTSGVKATSGTDTTAKIHQFTVETTGGSGNFTDSSQSLGDSDSVGVSLGDVDGDGDLDAFVANFGENKVWLNNGSGNFSETTQSLGDSFSRGVSLGDVNGDGDLDAFVANRGEANKVWLNNGSGNFSETTQSLGDSDSAGVSLGDVDGDGDLDAFVANFGENKVWLNNGSGNFSETTQSLGDSSSLGVSLGDVDGDGDLDAFVANRYGANKVWLNNGSGNFSETTQSLGDSDSVAVSLGDVDGDGDLDAFVANFGEANKVWLNNGSGNFSETTQSLGDSDSVAVSLGDVDGDGDLDAFVANYGENKVWLNNGSGNFTDSFQSLGSSLSLGVSLGDVNGDGDIDAFVANSGANKVWLNNNTPEITSSTTFSVAENSTAVGKVTATDAENDSLTYSISGGEDASLFDIDAQSGELSFKNAPDFETPSDDDKKNDYQVTVEVSDGNLTTTQDVTVTVTDENEPPTITSNSAFSVAENSITNLIITTTDVDGDNLTYSISGDDASFFDIDAQSGELSFKNAPDFETPSDDDKKNDYQITVEVSDGNLTATQAVTVTVTDENEAPTVDKATFNIDENSDEGTQVGIINATEPENEALNFVIESGNLDPDNDSNLAFAIDPSTGKITVNDKDDLDFETTPSFNLEVKATDISDLSDTAQVTINLNDVPLKTFDTSDSENGFFNLFGESRNLKFTLNNIGSSNANEVGVFVVDDENGTIDGIAPNEEGYLQAALERAQVIFSTISELPNGFELEDVEQVLEFDCDVHLGFYLIPDGTTQTALAQLESTGTTDLPVFFSNSSSLQVSEFSENGFNLNWSEVEGGNDFTAVELSVGLTDDTPAPFTELQRETQLELLDLRDVTGSVDVQVEVHREAAFDNLIGFYQVVDSNGGIDTSGDGIADFNVGDTGYKQAALENRITSLGLLGTDDGTSTTINGNFDGGGIIASFMIVDGTIEEALNGTKETYFSYLGANNGVDRVRLLGENIFGYEDWNDNDFNDLIIEITV